MIRNLEDNELSRFYDSVVQEVRTIQETSEEGGNFEQIFTQWALDLLVEGGETENFLLGYDERFFGTKNQHKINGWAISENYETVDLFITIYKGNKEFEKIPKDEIDTAVKRISNFFSKSVYGDYVGQIAETSQIFDFAHTLSRSQELKENLVRVNAVIITDGIYSAEFSESKMVSGYPVYYRVVDLNYLYNITEKSHIPIEINFADEGFDVPCIAGSSDNSDYQSYLAIIPGMALATIYERFGSRLLEQNVRSFLQFTGKINKGIRHTIINEPHMFLAFNNGLAATAEAVEFVNDDNGMPRIGKIHDLQIVNGGQTTASIYHTYKKDKADLSGIFVQLKLTVIRNSENFSLIVSQISEFANTQNKVSVSDLSSNRPFHIEMEKISRITVTPHVQGKTAQTYWFYERARGQYKNARLKEGFRKSRQATFDLKYPKEQVFTKEDLAKFVNSYQEVYEGKKLVIGPHFVVRGNQKNYKQFIDHNLATEVDNIYFEDVVAKMLLFRKAEKLYGVKPNAIGDMRYITVPYSVAWLNHFTGGKIDLYKIWRNQAVSDSLGDLLYQVMEYVEAFIKKTAPGSLYGEWAKKEECWLAVKAQKFLASTAPIADDVISARSGQTRKKKSGTDIEQQQTESELELLRSVTPQSWIRISAWGKDSGELTDHQRTAALTLSSRVRQNTTISEHERRTGLAIFEKVVAGAAELLDDEDYTPVPVPEKSAAEITPDLIAAIVKWDRRNKRLKPYEFSFMNDLATGKIAFNERNVLLARRNLEKIMKYGFSSDTVVNDG